MKLFYTQSSPYAACVRAIIIELGSEEQVELCETQPFDNQLEFLQANPLGKVPCLIDQGEVILDSEVICDYLDANISGGLLFEPVYGDWRLKSFYAICSGLMDVSVGLRQEDMRESEGCRSEFWSGRYKEAITRTLKQVEQRLALLPDRFTIIHITLYCALAYLDFRHSELNWRKHSPELAEWFAQTGSRGCLEQTRYQ
jgi:glutathione S-transferase